MDEATYRGWHALHLRVAREEPLSASEQTFYEAGLRQMHEDEVLHTDFTALRSMRHRIRDLIAENELLRSQRIRLDSEIAQLESQLNERTRKLLGVGEG